MMNLKFRRALRQDGDQVSRLIYTAEKQMQDYLYGFRPEGALPFIQAAFLEPRGYFGFSQQWVGVLDETIVCSATAYPGCHFLRLLGQSTWFSLRYYGLWESLQHVIPRARYLEGLFLRPQSQSLYLANIAVQPSFRRQGLGSQLLIYLCNLAIKQGLTQLELDVSVANPRAEALYHRLGFRVIAEMHPIPHAPSQIQGVKRMVRPVHLI